MDFMTFLTYTLAVIETAALIGALVLVLAILYGGRIPCTRSFINLP